PSPLLPYTTLFRSSAVGSSAVGLETEERRAARATENLGLTGGRRFMKVHIPARDAAVMTVPYTVKKHGGGRIPSETALPETYYSELGLQCARSGVATGVVIVNFPNVKGRTVCYAL